jgi:hypothetical protein
LFKFGVNLPREREMARKKSPIFVFGKDVARSRAYRSLKLSASFIVYNEFLMRRVIQKISGKRGKRTPVIVNNGRIEFTYGEAEKMGISRPRFERAITELVEKGLIDITHAGGGCYGNKSLYAISNRWRKFGTKDFDIKTREKDTRVSIRMKAYHKR